MAIDSNKLQQQAADLSSQLWAIANDLRGGMDANEFRNYILGTIFYRYLSERTEMYMQDILKEDGLSYEQAFSDADFKPIVEQWSIEHLGYIIHPENLFRELNRKIIKPNGDADKFSVEDYERAVNELTGSTLGHKSEKAFEGLFNDMRLQDTRLGDTVSERTEKIGKVIAKIGEIDMNLQDQQFDVLGTAYMILIGLFQSGAGRRVASFLRRPVHPSYAPHLQRWDLMKLRPSAIARAVPVPCSWRHRNILPSRKSATSTVKRTIRQPTTLPA